MYYQTKKIVKIKTILPFNSYYYFHSNPSNENDYVLNTHPDKRGYESGSNNTMQQTVASTRITTHPHLYSQDIGSGFPEYSGFYSCPPLTGPTFFTEEQHSSVTQRQQSSSSPLTDLDAHNTMLQSQIHTASITTVPQISPAIPQSTSTGSRPTVAPVDPTLPGASNVRTKTPVPLVEREFLQVFNTGLTTPLQLDILVRPGNSPEFKRQVLKTLNGIRYASLPH